MIARVWKLSNAPLSEGIEIEEIMETWIMQGKKLVFVRDGIYNSVADYNLTWRVSCVCVCVCLCVCVSRGKLRSWITFERFELEG